VQETQEPIKSSPKTADSSVSSDDKRAEGHLNDTNWTLQKLEEKFTMLGTYSWDIAQTPGTIISSFNIPEDVLVTPALKFPFDVTGYWRAKSVVFKINITASPFYSGKLICGFFPSMTHVDATDPNVHLTLVQLGGVQMSVADNQAIEFRIPYRHYLAWIEAPKDTLGQFYIAVLNQLRTGANNANNVTVTAFVALEDSEFRVPEFVPPAQYSSHKFDGFQVIESTQQSGQKIVLSKKPFTINDSMDKIEPTMMCAGKGLVQMPKTLQFADHPIDLVELGKRYLTANTDLVTVAPFNNSKPGRTMSEYGVLEFLIQRTSYFDRMYALWRGGLNFKVIPHVTGANPKNVEGRIYLTNNEVPTTSDLVDNEIGNRFKGGSHRFDCDSPAEFTIPYLGTTFTSTYYQTNQTQPGIGICNNRLYIVFENYDKIEADVRLEIMVALGDDFTTGVFLGTPSLIYPQQQQPLKQHTPHPQPNAYTKIYSRKQSGIIEHIGRAIENTIPVIEDIGELTNLLDAHPVSYQAMPVRPRKIGYTQANNQIQFVERLGMTNLNGLNLTDSEAYGMKEKETDIYELMTKVKTLVARGIQWSDSDQQGKILFSDLIGPLTQVIKEVPPPMDVFALDFNFWTGSIIYIIEVIASQNHHGRLTLTYHPNLIEAPPSLTEATQQYFTSFDLQGGRSIIAVTIPYLAKVPYRPVTKVGGNYPYPYDKSSAPFNGCIALRVQNPLRGAATVSSTVEVNVYRMAGKDFRLDSYGSAYNIETTV